MARPLVTLLHLSLLVCGTAAQAGDMGPALGQKHIIQNAIRMQVTPRGQKYFDTRLSAILGNLGINPEEGYFPTQSFSAEKAYSMTELQTNTSEAAKVFLRVRDMLTKWLVGFSLKDPRPTVEIGNSGYVAQFSRFGLVTDEVTMSKLGKRDGAVLAIEMEVKKLSLNMKTVKAWDLSNPVLGKLELDDMNVVAGSDANPMKVRLPFYIHITPSGDLEFQTLDVTDNLEKTDISATYKKILTPQISVTIEGKTYPFNTSEIDKMLNSKMPDILISLRSQLDDFAKRTLPDMLNKKAKEYLSGALEQIQDMSPPGADDGDKRPNFKWGVKVASIDLKKSLNVTLHSYIEDTLNPNVPLDSTSLSRGEPKMNALPMETYDVGLAVDRGVINRVMQLAFLRKNFEKIAQPDGTTFTLGKAPTIDYIAPVEGITLKPREALVKLHVNMEQRPNRSFVKDVIYIELDIIARLSPCKGGMQLIIARLDTNSVFMDPKYLTTAGSFIPGVSSLVNSTIRAQVQAISDNYARTESAIPGVLPLPPEILGAKFDINKVNMDPNGQLVMYLNYAAGAFPATVTAATATAANIAAPVKNSPRGGKK
jgi:hypothetical protein